MPNWNGTWSGGRTYLTKEGKKVWLLRKTHLGTEYQIKLDVSSERDALAELAMFNRNPAEYRTKSQAQADATEQGIYLDAQLIGRFLEHKRKVLGEDGELYIRGDLAFYLAQWAAALAGRDFRKVKFHELKTEINRHPTARKNRISALKSLAAWLREEGGSLTIDKDPTAALKVPSPKSAKAERHKGYTIEEVEKFYAALTTDNARIENKYNRRKVDTQVVRDIVCLQVMLAMHYREVRRFAKGGDKLTTWNDQGEIAATIEFRHKNRDQHVQSIDKKTAEAAMRLLKRGSIPSESFTYQIAKRISERTGMKHFKFGEFRHCFVTWASEGSAHEVEPAKGKAIALSKIAAAIGHKVVATTKRHYDHTQIPAMVALHVNLQNDEDPGAPVRESNVVPLRGSL